MANKKISAFVSNPTRSSLDTLTGLDVSASAANQNAFWSLNTLFSEISLNTTDGSIRWGGVAAPAVSAAGSGAIYFDSTSNTFKVSQNGGAYFNIGNITTTGFTSTRIPIANGANTLTDDAGLTFNTTTDFLTLGTSGGGGATFVGTNGNTVSLAASTPSAATYLYFLPNAAPTVGQFLYAAAVGAQTTLGWQTAPSGTGSANQIAVWGASNALTGSSALTFTSGVVAISGTTNPGVTITGTAATESGITVNQSVSGAAADAFHSFQTPSSTVVWRLTTAGFTPTGLIKANQLDMFGATGTVEMLFRLADASTRFVYGVNNVEAASINATSTLGLVLGAASTLTGRVRMYNSAGTTYSQISAGNAGSSLNFIWPVVNPLAGQVLSASAPSGSDVTLSWTSASPSAPLTATQVGFGDGSNLLSGSADFTYATATGVLDITKSVNGSLRMTVTNGSNGNAAQARFGATADVAFTGIIAYGSGFTTSGLRTANSSVIDMDGTAGSIFIGNASGSFRWGLGTTEYARMTTTVFTLYGPTTGSVTGLSVTSAAAGSGATIAVLSSGTNESLVLTPKGTGNLLLSTGLFQLLGTDNNYPAWKRSGVNFFARLADDSNYTSVYAQTFVPGGSGVVGSTGTGIVDVRNTTAANAASFHVYGTLTDTSNYERAAITNVSGTGFTLSAQTAGTGADNLSIAITPAGTGLLSLGVGSTINVTSDGRLYGTALHNNAGAVTGTTNQYVASGTYTPTVTAVANCTATSSGPCNWIRVGNVVTVSGIVAVDPTSATTFTSVGISLPIASNFATNASECSGVAANANVQGYSGAITADFTNDRAQLDFTTGTDVANQGWSFVFSYVVL